MPLLATVAGFGAWGFASRCFALGIQKRGMFEGQHLPFHHKPSETVSDTQHH